MVKELYDTYEHRVWKRGDSDWAWEVREEGWAKKPFASGSRDTRKAANVAVQNAIEEYRAHQGAPWKKTQYLG